MSGPLVASARHHGVHNGPPADCPCATIIAQPGPCPRGARRATSGLSYFGA